MRASEITGCFLAAFNLFTFLLYGIDKRKAVHHRWRIPERVLILCAFLGGAAGALLGMVLFHHKTRKWKFRILVPAALILWCLILGFLFTKTSGQMNTITVTSSSLENGRWKSACAADRAPNDPAGENKSPELTFSDVPGADYEVVLMIDATADNWLHLYFSGPWTTHLDEGVLSASSYIGPYPPKGSGDHTYEIRVFALQKDPSGITGQLDAPCDVDTLYRELKPLGILAEGTLSGVYRN